MMHVLLSSLKYLGQYRSAAGLVLSVICINSCASSGGTDNSSENKASTPVKRSMKPYTQLIPDSEINYSMTPIKGGQYRLPQKAGDTDGSRRTVQVSSFWMGTYEVTWDQYHLWSDQPDRISEKLKTPNNKEQRLADAVSWPSPPYHQTDHSMGYSGYPAIGMSQLAAKQFCKWLSMKTGHFYRLPTEAEWEYACRAGTDTAYSFGDDKDQLSKFGWFAGNGEDQYHPVGKKKPNPWGLYDMHGNVAEWVLDQFVQVRYDNKIGVGGQSSNLIVNPVIWPAERYPRVVRGGSWFDEAKDLRTDARARSEADWNAGDGSLPKSIWWLRDASWVGFRVVRPLNPPPRSQWGRYWGPDLEIEREVYDEQRQLRNQQADPK
jgi:formylglycine-generating enzyme required for sulfatase activity